MKKRIIDVALIIAISYTVAVLTRFVIYLFYKGITIIAWGSIFPLKVFLAYIGYAILPILTYFFDNNKNFKKNLLVCILFPILLIIVDYFLHP